MEDAISIQYQFKKGKSFSLFWGFLRCSVSGLLYARIASAEIMAWFIAPNLSSMSCVVKC